MIRPWNWQGEWQPGGIAGYPGGGLSANAPMPDCFRYSMSDWVEDHKVELLSHYDRPSGDWATMPFAVAKAWLLEDLGLADA